MAKLILILIWVGWGEGEGNFTPFGFPLITKEW